MILDIRNFRVTQFLEVHAARKYSALVKFFPIAQYPSLLACAFTPQSPYKARHATACQLHKPSADKGMDLAHNWPKIRLFFCSPY
jgi:hypothetical protein